MKVLFAKCTTCIENFLDDLDTLLLGLLFIRFERKLTKLAKQRDRKHTELLEIQKEYDCVSATYQTIQQHGL